MMMRLDNWSRWGIVIFIIMLVASFLLLACCGMYALFNNMQQVILTDSAETQTAADQLAEIKVTVPQPAVVSQAELKKRRAEKYISQIEIEESDLVREREGEVSSMTNFSRFTTV